MTCTPVYFAKPSDFRKWLEENHLTETELLVGFYKVGSRKPSITWSESVDEALCFGWIDGIRKSIDEQSYCIRFTPRSPKSTWSAVNIKKVEEMTNLGKMFPAGLAAFEKRTSERSVVYSYENRPEKLDPELEEQFKANFKAWIFFSEQAPSYRKTILYWVMSAKRKQTRLARLGKLIAASESGQRVF